MMYATIYFNDTPLIIADKLTAQLQKKELPNIFNEPKLAEINAVVDNLKSGDADGVIFISKNPEKIFNRIARLFKPVAAAGGVIQNMDKDILFIYRREKWDLPKGKIDKGETPEQAAEREVEEETGAKDLHLRKKIGETFHTYFEKEKWMLKTTHWFYFTSETKQKLAPQLEEDITLIQWFSTRDIRTPMQNTFANIKDILSQYFDKP